MYSTMAMIVLSVATVPACIYIGWRVIMMCEAFAGGHQLGDPNASLMFGADYVSPGTHPAGIIADTLLLAALILVGSITWIVSVPGLVLYVWLLRKRKQAMANDEIINELTKV